MPEDSAVDDEILENQSNFGTKNMHGLYINLPKHFSKTASVNKLNQPFSRYSYTDFKKSQGENSGSENIPKSAANIKSKILNFQIN